MIIATGGFAADYSADGILAKVRPDLLRFATTNGEHCTGDGIKMAQAVGASTVDMASVQARPPAGAFFCLLAPGRQACLPPSQPASALCVPLRRLARRAARGEGKAAAGA